MKILFTTGDVNGIGLEIFIKAIINNNSYLANHQLAIVSNTAVMGCVISKYYNDFCKVEGNSIAFKNID